MQLYKLNQLLLDMHSGGTPDTSESEYWNGNFKWLSSGETRQRFIDNTESRITQLGVEKSSTKLAKKNDVVMACAGQGKTRGQVSFLLDDMYINQSVIAMTTDEKILHPLYLFYNLSGRYDELRGSSDASSTRGSITTKSLKKLAMLIPNIELQKKITDILIAYDNLIENNNKRIHLLEQMAENLYKEWFVRFRFPGYEDVGFENGVPKNWDTRRLKDIVRKSGKSIKKENLTENLKYVPIDCIDSKTMVLLKNDDLENASSSLQTFKTNDILFGAMRPYFHKVSLSHFDGVTRTTCFVIAPKKKEYKYFLYLLLFQEATVNFATTISVGSTMPYVRWEDFIRMNVVVPDIETAKRFSMEIDPLMKEMKNLSEINKLLARQRDYLLPRLMSGKLEV